MLKSVIYCIPNFFYNYWGELTHSGISCFMKAGKGLLLLNVF